MSELTINTGYWETIWFWITDEGRTDTEILDKTKELIEEVRRDAMAENRGRWVRNGVDY